MTKRILLLLMCIAATAQADTTFVSGSTFGRWTTAGSPYILVGSVSVPLGRTLSIDPGVRIESSAEELSISVSGQLVAQGTVDEPVLFTIDTTAYPDRWAGIRIPAGDAILRHCIIEHASYDAGTPQLASGINCRSGTLEMSDCIVQYCQQRPAVGVFEQSEAIIERCTIRHNQLGFGCCGGGISVRAGSRAEIRDCDIYDNSAVDGGGIYVSEEATAVIERCVISQNTAQIWGGGIATGGNGNIIIRRCQIMHNTSANSGGGIEARSYNLVVERCNLIGNHAEEGRQVNTDLNPVAFNSCIFAHYGGSSGAAAALQLTENARISHCLIHVSGATEPLGGFPPPGLGELVRTNVNGDTTDAFFNVYSDPAFVNSQQGDWHLLPNSPCIDAGDPALGDDPDSTIADIGVFYFAQSVPVTTADLALPRAVELHRAYPNPFNPTTTLSFSLSRPMGVSLRVMDVLGRTTAVLVDGPLRNGLHSYVWQAESQPSGIYFAELSAGSHSDVEKLVLLK